MPEGSFTPPDAIPPRRKLFPGAVSSIKRNLSLDPEVIGSQMLARERAIPNLMTDLRKSTSEYYEEFVAVTDNLEARRRKVWPGQKPGHFVNQWEDKLVFDPHANWNNYIFKSALYFDKESLLLAKPELKSYSTGIWTVNHKDNKNPQGIIAIEFVKGDIREISMQGNVRDIAMISARQAGFSRTSEWGSNQFFGEFLHKHFMFDSSPKIRIILFPEPAILLYNKDALGKTHTSSYKFDSISEEPVFRGDLPTSARKKRFLAGGAYQEDTLTPDQFKSVVKGALLALPKTA